MKFKLIFMMFAFIFSCELYSEPVFEKIIYDISRIKMNSLALESADFGIAVGENGIVCIIKDSGKVIEYLDLGIKSHLNSIAQRKKSSFVCAGDNGKIFLTDSDGLNWTESETGTSKNLNSIIFTDENTGVAVGEEGIILTSSDGGKNWNKSESINSDELLEVTKSLGNILYAAGTNGTVIKSTDFGITWNKIAVPKNVNFQSIKAVGQNKLYIMGDSLTVLVSDDAGISFSSPVLQNNYSTFYKFPEIFYGYFFDENEGYIKLKDYYNSNPRDYEYYTYDGGKTWVSFNMITYSGPYKPFNPSCIDYTDKQFGITFNADGSTYKTYFSTSNIQYTLLIEKSEISLFNIDSKDSKNISFIYGMNAPEGIYSSENSGITWNLGNTVDTLGRYRGTRFYDDFNMTDKNTLLIAMHNYRDSANIIKFAGYILKTTDLGKTWSEFILPNKEKIEKLVMYDKSYGLLQLATKQYMSTTDGGSTWEYKNLPDTTIKYISKIFSLGPEHSVIYASTNDDKYRAYITQNGGIDWDSSLVLSSEFDNLQFLGENKIIAIGNSLDMNQNAITKIIESTDGGITWNDLFISDVSDNLYLSKVIHYDENSLAAISWSNDLYITNDCWKTFDKYSDLMSDFENITDIYFIEKNKLLITGDRGTLLSYTNIPVSFNDKTVENDLSIYPNPARDYIIVKSSDGLQTSEDYNVQIFNIFGVKVGQSSLIDGNNRINVSNLQPGVYYIRIGDKVEKFVKM